MTAASSSGNGDREAGDAVVTVRRALEAAYAQLQSSNETLAAANDELRTTIAELETTNGELQVANEELEALTQELHAANDEIATISDELRRRSDETDEVNAYLTSVLDALDHAVVVVDADLKVRTWYRMAQRRWGRTRQETVRRSLPGLELDLPMDELLEPLRSLVDGDDAEPVFDLRSAELRPPSGPCVVRLAALRPVTGAGAGTGAVIVVTAADSADVGPAANRH
jgi:two-component system CheB/CheR fusion protein